MLPAWIMATGVGVPVRADASTAAERWAAWVARGVAHDSRTRKRAIAAAAVAAIGLGLWLASVLAFG
jgi:hypothetical protein